MSGAVRALVLEDSILVRRLLEDHLGDDPQMELIIASPRGISLRSLVVSECPHVVVVDPAWNEGKGVALIRELTQLGTCVVVAMSQVQASSPLAIEAVRAGAVALVQRPTADCSTSTFTMLRHYIIWSARRGARAMPAPTVRKPPSPHDLIAIGASTGGTQAIEAVLGGLSTDLPPVVIVQHMPAEYTWRFANRLNAVVGLPVCEATDGAVLEAGKVYIAPGERHLRVLRRGGNLTALCSPGDKVSGHCPSVDVLFDSVAATCKRRAVGVLLTGMGADGARGLLAMRRAGATTAAQNEQTSTVFGMPKVAIEMGAADAVLALGEVSRWINQRAITPAPPASNPALRSG